MSKELTMRNGEVVDVREDSDRGVIEGTIRLPRDDLTPEEIDAIRSGSVPDEWSIGFGSEDSDA